MRKWLLALTVLQVSLLAAPSHGADLVRQFSSVDGPIHLDMLETEHQGNPVTLVRLRGTTHEDAGRVFMFSSQKNGRYQSLNEASRLVLIDYGRKRLVSGTMKKVWTLAGLEAKDVVLEEVEPPASLKANELRASYQAAEGGVDSPVSLSAAQEALRQACGTSMKIELVAASFDRPNRPPSAKVSAAISGVAETCRDNDYRAALQEFKVLSVAGIDGSALRLEKNGKVLVLNLPEDIQNTSRAVRKLIEQKL